MGCDEPTGRAWVDDARPYAIADTMLSDNQVGDVGGAEEYDCPEDALIVGDAVDL